MCRPHRLGRFADFGGWISRAWRLALLLTLLALIVPAEGPPPSKLDTRIDYLLAGRQFDFMTWEVGALLGKLAHTLVAPQRYMDEPTRRDFLLDYLQLVADTGRLGWEIGRAYADPAVEDAEAATSGMRVRLADLRREAGFRQPLAEAIMEEQVISVFLEEGFGTLGQELPPIGAHFTPLPLLLVVSPRDHIENVFSLALEHGLNAAEQEAIEGQVATSFDVSSLVTGIGGLSAYPAMLLESSSLNWVVEVTAHEWMHHYLMQRPLGMHYDSSPEARTINETVASIVGKEIGRQVVARYYPELLPPEPEPAPPADDEEAPHSQPAEFDFRAEMRSTRMRVDELLGQGRVEEAEAYMEARRQEFVDQGYYIRRLNQAYFAFHGAYADEPGAAGADPIGPTVSMLRAQAPDLHTFVTMVARVTTLSDLEALLDPPDAAER